jgi:hypothetical protein
MSLMYVESRQDQRRSLTFSEVRKSNFPANLTLEPIGRFDKCIVCHSAQDARFLHEQYATLCWEVAMSVSASA